MKIKILESALEDIKKGRNFYEQQKEGLGSYFVDNIILDIESLKYFAGIHQKVFSEYHRLLSRKFPFAIYYKIIENNIIVFAVLDCRQNPQKTEKRLKEKND